jgi:hypothetical protein
MTPRELRHFAESLRRIDKHLGEILQQLKDAIRANNPPSDKHAEPRPDIPVYVVAERSNTEVGRYETDTKSDKRFQSRSLTVQWCLFTATILAFGAAAYYASIADKQRDIMKATLDESRKQTTASQSAINQARDQFRLDQRPYIALTHRSDQPEDSISPPPLFVDKNGQVLWTIWIMNYGRSPAYHVRALGYVELRGKTKSVLTFDGAKEDGAAMPPNKRDFLTPGSRVPISREEFTKLIGTDDAIILHFKVAYTDCCGGTYETGICLKQFATGVSHYCAEENYMK